MPKTTQEIWDDLNIHCQQALYYGTKKYALKSKKLDMRWYSENEIKNLTKHNSRKTQSAKKDYHCSTCGSYFTKTQYLRHNCR